MCKATTVTPKKNIGDRVDEAIGGAFYRLGRFVCGKPRLTIVLCFILTVICGGGFARFTTESRGEKLWVPQNTIAEWEQDQYLQYFPRTARVNNIIVQSETAGDNVLTKERLLAALSMHKQIEILQSIPENPFEDDAPVEKEEEESYNLLDLCVRGGGSCTNSSQGGVVCQCLIQSILRIWNYDMDTLLNDNNILQTISNDYGTRQDLEAALGNAQFDEETNEIISAEAFSITYLLKDRSVEKDGEEYDWVNESWEKDVFLHVVETLAPDDYPSLSVEYFSSRSFSDEFGGAITGDLLLVQVSYAVVFLFMGATLGRIRCGPGSRWTMALAALFMVGLSTAAGFGISSAIGLFYGPVHSLLPFVLLGIGVDDAFVIVNAFDRQRRESSRRGFESNEDMVDRCAKALAKAGASITVTSLTDLVAFAISSSSGLPALASFCAFAAICIAFLWFFASTFFTACLVLDERRQRDKRRECFCCLSRKESPDAHVENGQEEEGNVSKYFRNYHAPAILSKPGKAIVLLFFTGVLAFGIFGAMNLSVEDSQRNFIPRDSYLQDYIDAADEYYPSSGTELDIIFEDGNHIYRSRQEIATLDDHFTGLSSSPPYIAEPISESVYRNVLAGFAEYLSSQSINMDTMTQDEFMASLREYTAIRGGPGSMYAQDVSFDANGGVNAIKVKLEYVSLMKERRGEMIDDADKQIKAMDSIRSKVDELEDSNTIPSAFTFCDKFLNIEGFKIIRRELFQNVGLALVAVAIIVFLTVANITTTLLITLNVAFCIIEILGFMFATGIVIDSVSVINIVLAVGLSVDYSAHVAHCFMVKTGKESENTNTSSKDQRVIEALADIGAAVLNGATTTFLAVVVLLFSSSYVFQVLSKQFALTVFLGIIHGLVLLPVLLSILGPKPYASSEEQQYSEEEEQGEQHVDQSNIDAAAF